MIVVWQRFYGALFSRLWTLTDPEKDYHLEFVVPYRYISRDLAKLLHEWNLAPKQLERRGAMWFIARIASGLKKFLR